MHYQYRPEENPAARRSRLTERLSNLAPGQYLSVVSYAPETPNGSEDEPCFVRGMGQSAKARWMSILGRLNEAARRTDPTNSVQMNMLDAAENAVRGLIALSEMTLELGELLCTGPTDYEVRLLRIVNDAARVMANCTNDSAE